MTSSFLLAVKDTVGTDTEFAAKPNDTDDQLNTNTKGIDKQIKKQSNMLNFFCKSTTNHKRSLSPLPFEPKKNSKK